MAEASENSPKEQENTQKGKYLTFMLGQEVYAIEIKYVMEIIGLLPITVVPKTPVYVKGIINLRGKIIPVIDVRLKFKKPPLEYDDRTCIIVIEVESIIVGLIVDSIKEVLTIADEDIDPPMTISETIENKYIKGIGKVEHDVKLILSCEKLTESEE